MTIVINIVKKVIFLMLIDRCLFLGESTIINAEVLWK